MQWIAFLHTKLGLYFYQLVFSSTGLLKLTFYSKYQSNPSPHAQQLAKFSRAPYT